MSPGSYPNPTVESVHEFVKEMRYQVRDFPEAGLIIFTSSGCDDVPCGINRFDMPLGTSIDTCDLANVADRLGQVHSMRPILGLGPCDEGYYLYTQKAGDRF